MVMKPGTSSQCLSQAECLLLDFTDVLFPRPSPQSEIYTQYRPLCLLSPKGLQGCIVGEEFQFFYAEWAGAGGPSRRDYQQRKAYCLSNLLHPSSVSTRAILHEITIYKLASVSIMSQQEDPSIASLERLLKVRLSCWARWHSTAIPALSGPRQEDCQNDKGQPGLQHCHVVEQLQPRMLRPGTSCSTSSTSSYYVWRMLFLVKCRCHLGSLPLH